MKVLYELKDKQFPYNGITHTRIIVRAVVINSKNQIAFIKLHGKDELGDRNYYELPGGGKEYFDGTLIDALEREMEEEIGFTIKNIVPLGRVIDYYNVLKRRNDNHYYLAYTSINVEEHLTAMENMLFEKIVWVDIDKAYQLFASSKDSPLSILVKNRELPIIALAIEKHKEKEVLKR